MIDSSVLFFFVAVIIVGVLMLFFITKGRRSKVLDTAYYRREWASIVDLSNKDMSSQQFAILQADKLLDKALKDRGFAGSTMAERLTSASRAFSRRDDVWSAHKLRNKIAHEHNIQLNKVWTKKALRSFQRGLQDLGAL